MGPVELSGELEHAPAGAEAAFRAMHEQAIDVAHDRYQEALDELREHAANHPEFWSQLAPDDAEALQHQLAKPLPPKSLLKRNDRPLDRAGTVGERDADHAVGLPPDRPPAHLVDGVPSARRSFDDGAAHVSARVLVGVGGRDDDVALAPARGGDLHRPDDRELVDRTTGRRAVIVARSSCSRSGRGSPGGSASRISRCSASRPDSASSSSRATCGCWRGERSRTTSSTCSRCSPACARGAMVPRTPRVTPCGAASSGSPSGCRYGSALDCPMPSLFSRSAGPASITPSSTGKLAETARGRTGTAKLPAPFDAVQAITLHGRLALVVFPVGLVLAEVYEGRRLCAGCRHHRRADAAARGRGAAGTCRMARCVTTSATRAVGAALDRDVLPPRRSFLVTAACRTRSQARTSHSNARPSTILRCDVRRGCRDERRSGRSRERSHARGQRCRSW